MPRTFDRTYRRYWGFVRSVLQRQRVPPADLDDVAQEVFLVFLRRLGPSASFDGVRGWLFEVSRRVASNHRRRCCRHARRRPPSHDPIVTPEDGALRRESIDMLERFVDELSTVERRVFALSELEGKPGRVIAERLDLPLHVVYRKVRAIRRSLAEAVGVDPPRSKRKWMFAVWPWRTVVPVAGVTVLAFAAASPDAFEHPALGQSASVQAGSRPKPTRRTPGSEPNGAAKRRSSVKEPLVPASPADLEARRDHPRPRREARESEPARDPFRVPEAWDLPAKLALSVPPMSPTRSRQRASIPHALTWRGRFVDNRGRPVAHALVYCRRLAGRGVRRRCFRRGEVIPRTDHDGYVEIGPLRPGTYELVTFDRGARTTAASLTRVVINRKVEPNR